MKAEAQGKIAHIAKTVHTLVEARLHHEKVRIQQEAEQALHAATDTIRKKMAEDMEQVARGLRDSITVEALNNIDEADTYIKVSLHG